MKNFYFAIPASMACLGLMTACSGDEAQEIMKDGATETHFINVTIAMSQGGTRETTSSDFEKGGDDESAISSVTFVFYNASGNVIATSDVQSPLLTAGTSSVENTFTAQVEFELPVGAILPSYVMAFANPIDPSETKSLSISQIATDKRNTYKNAASKFAMTNAVYFDWDTKKQVMAVATPTNYYYTNEAEKDAAPTAEIYIERIAAKVETKKDAAIDIQNVTIKDADNNEQTLTFVIDSWGLNCLEKQTYCLKYYNPAVYNTTFITNEYNYQTPSKVFDGWNEPTNHRSYWANSVTYGQDANKYPDVSDDLLISSAPNFLDDTKSSATDYYTEEQSLQYYSFNQMTDPKTYPSTSFNVGKSAYLLENTVAQAIPSAMASVIICGHYEQSGNPVSSFYVIGDTYFTEDNLKKYMLALNKEYLKKDDVAVADTDIGDFEIMHPTKGLNIVDGEYTKNVERLVTIQLKSTECSKYKYKQSDGTFEAVTTSNLEAVNQAIYENAQVAEAYTDGKAYFVWPIRHLNNIEGGLGYYGVVRNHYYQVIVKSIKGLGIGVFNPDIPIIPVDNTTTLGLKVKVNILAWRLVTNKAE